MPAGSAPPSSKRIPLAITGIGCRFAGGVRDVDSLWRLLDNGADGVVPVPPDRWNSKLFYSADKDRPGSVYVREGAFLTDPIDRFDPEPFGISAREAAWLDPQQRLLLEVTHEALEDAGYPPESVRGSNTGVFVGGFMMDFQNLVTQPSNRPLLDSPSSAGNSATVLSARLSYVWDLRGPCLTIDTACSSSLVALHFACMSLWAGDCEAAIVGGASVILNPQGAVSLCKARLLAPDGRSKAFDARADGYGRGEGAAVVLLKPLDRAIANRDRVYAVIRGTATNQDGRTPGGMSVPSEQAQERVLRAAYELAGLRAADVHYVEAHGTGTSVGDSTEARALGAVLGRDRGRAPLLIGSVKTNIGHTEAAAGVAGLVKAALCLYKKKIPPSLQVQELNPAIPFGELGLRVAVRAEEFPAGERGRFVGVNSFGYGGSNAHAVLGEAPPGADGGVGGGPSIVGRAPRSAPFVLPVSAEGNDALRARATSYREWIERAAGNGSLGLPDLVYTASARRGHYARRAAMVVSSLAEARELLGAIGEGRADPRIVSGSVVERPRLAWVFSGMGPQWWAMGRELLEQEPVFRAAIEECSTAFGKHVSWSLLDELGASEASSRIQNNEIAQTANFAMQVALVRLWRSWGVEPDAIVGHSIGEIAAAFAAGCLSFEEAALVIHHRGRLLNRAVGAGRMLAVGLPAREAEVLIAADAGRVAIAAVNAPNAVTLSGDAEPLERIAAKLETQGTFHQLLRVEVPYHSHHMAPMMAELGESLRALRPVAPRIPFYSTVTGKRVEGALHDAAYWVRNFRESVHFAEAVDQMLDDGCEVFVELSAHPVLTSFVTDCAAAKAKTCTMLPSVERKKPERPRILTTLATLHAQGVPIDWTAVSPEGRLVPLPFYPWQRQQFWIESDQSRQDRIGSVGDHPLLQTRLATAQPCWLAEVNDTVLSTLKDHCIQGTVVLPGTAYVEAALGMQEALSPGRARCLEGVRFHQALALDPSRFQVIQCAFDRREGGAFTIHSRVGDDPNAWVLHATGQSGRPPAAPAPSVDLGAMRKRLTPHEDAKVLYERLRNRGYLYGESFRAIRRYWVGDREVLGQIEPPAAVRSEQPYYVVHPALLDACLHSTLIVTPNADGSNGLDSKKPGDTYVPIAIDRVVVHRRVPDGRIWVHARLLEHGPASAISRVSVYDDDGRLIAELDGIRVQPLVRRAESARPYEGWLYEPRWEVAPEQAEPSTPTEAVEQWRILTDAPSEGKGLADRLRARGESASVARPGEPLDLGGRPAGVVCLWAGPGANASDEGMTAGLANAARLPELLQSLSRETADVRLWLVTRGAHAVRPGDRVEPAQGVIWGLGRVAINECRELAVRLVDLPFEPAAADFDELARRLCGGGAEEELALREGKAHVLRIAPVSASTLPTTVSRRVRDGEVAWTVRLRTPGDPSSAYFAEEEQREPAPDQILVHLEATAFAGLGAGTKEDHPTLGAGRVVRAGAQASGVAVGDRVLVLMPPTLGSQACVGRGCYWKVPPLVSAEQAAALEPWLSAKHGLVEVAGVGPSTRVLVAGAGSAWDVAAVRVALDAGARVAFASERTDDEPTMAAWGVARTPPPSSSELYAWVQEWTEGRGVDVLASAMTEEMPRRAPTIVRAGGRFLQLLGAPGPGRQGVNLRQFRPNTTLTAIDVLQTLAGDSEVASTLVRDSLDRAQAGKLPAVDALLLGPEELLRRLPEIGTGPLSNPVLMTLPDKPIRVAAMEPSLFRKSGTYLLTGGLGGLGLATARWMATNGARSLVLIGRSGASTVEARRGVEEVRAAGASVVVEKCDVTDRAQLTAVLDRIRASPGAPLRGVLHTANVFDDWTILDLTADRLRAGLAAKVLGAWNLHRLTIEDPIEHFVLFSSVTSLVGVTGLPVYTAGNSFLDALAHLRSTQGRAALSVNFGAAQEAGILARSASAARATEQQGFRPMPIGKLLATLGDLLSSDSVQMAVADVDWRQTARLIPSVDASPRFGLVRSWQADGDRRSFREQMADTPDEARGDLLVEHLRRWMGRALRAEPATIDPRVPINRLGFDSLLAAELRTHLETELGVVPRVMEFLAGPTIEQLATRLLHLFERSSEPTVEDLKAGVDPTVLAEELARVERLG